MSTWNTIVEEVKASISDADGIAYYRGHSDSAWQLRPSLARVKEKDIEYFEPTLYYSFITEAGSLLPITNSSWDNIYAMQHHGLPTRLLDWSESFSVALYFALEKAEKEAVVWILNPYKLNEEATNNKALYDTSALKGNYEDYFISRTVKMEGDVIALSPLRHHPRIFNQKCGFTIHNNSVPLEELHPNALKKIIITKDAFVDARMFLIMSGVNEFSLFPDLDGLARKIKKDEEI